MAGLGLEELKLVANVVASKDISEGQKARTAAGIINAAQRSKATKVAAAQKTQVAATKETTRLSERAEDLGIDVSEAKALSDHRKSQLAVGVRTAKVAEEKLTLARSKSKANEATEVLGIEEDIAKDITDPVVIPLMDVINNTQDKPYYYFHGDVRDPNFFLPAGLEGTKFSGQRLALPRNPRTGIQVTMEDVRETAAANNVSVKQILQQLGVLNANFEPK